MASIDYTKSMTQTFEFFKVNPGTWKDEERINNVTSCTFVWDLEDETLCYCTLSGSDLEGEYYVRVYIVMIQNGYRFRECIGTALVQTPSHTFNGKRKTFDIDAYSPLQELKEDSPPIGYAIRQGENAVDYLYRNSRDHMRAPIIKPDVSQAYEIKNEGGFVSTTDDTWLSFNLDLLKNIGKHYEINPEGRVLIAPDQDFASMMYTFEYRDDGLSILHPEISITKDLFEIPNVLEVIYSTDKEYFVSVSENNDPGSVSSVSKRGRRIVKRLVNPSGLVSSTQSEVDTYAVKMLKELSTIECTLSYSHGYCPVRIGDCVRIQYKRAGLTDIRAKVIRQTINCSTGCTVSEVVKFPLKLWR